MPPWRGPYTACRDAHGPVLLAPRRARSINVSFKFSFNIVKEHIILLFLKNGILFVFDNLGLLCGLGNWCWCLPQLTLPVAA